MNELVVFYTVEWLYYKTNCSTIKEAYKEFEDVCNRNGIDISNMVPIEMALRDKNGNNIEIFKE